MLSNRRCKAKGRDRFHLPAAPYRGTGVAMRSPDRCVYREQATNHFAVALPDRWLAELSLRNPSGRAPIAAPRPLSVKERRHLPPSTCRRIRPRIRESFRPTAALDPEIRDHFFSTLDNLNRDQDVTIVLITHDIATIGKYASKLLYLDKKLVFFGSFEDFCSSENMTKYFGEFAQHLICHRHD